MPVKYYGVPKRDPRDLAAPVKYYPVTRCSGRKKLRDLAAYISRISSVNCIDMTGVMEALLFAIPLELADGYIVDLGDFGTFRLVLRGSMAAAGEEVVARDIVKGRVVFKPGKQFKRVLRALDFQRSTPPRKPSR